MIMQKLNYQRILTGKDMRVGSPMMLDMDIDVDTMDLEMARTMSLWHIKSLLLV